MSLSESAKKQTQANNNQQNSTYNNHKTTIIIGLTVITLLVIILYWIITSINYSTVIFSLGKDLTKTEKTGTTNFLLLGVGGKNHDGSNLTDTIIVASLNYDKKTITMLSIPRDFYVRSKSLGNIKINSLYPLAKNKYGKKEAIKKLEDAVTKITSIPIQYYVKMEVKGYKEVVDCMEWINIRVKKRIYDPYYPKGETIKYETFIIEKGPQHLDGETALKYARSRKTTSDFDRAKRQQQIIYAIKDKALKLNIITNPAKIQALYNSVAENLETNLSIQEIIQLAKITKDFKKEDIIPIVLNDDPQSCGGLLYTPIRDYFGGASVLLPAGNNFSYIKLFTNTTLNNIDIIEKQEEIQVLNGTRIPGLAWEGLELLNRFCLNGAYYGNASERNLKESTIYYKPDENGNPPNTLKIVTTLMPLKTKAGIPEEYLEGPKRENAVIVVELGKDYLEKRIKDPFKTLKYTTPIAKPKTNTEKTETSTTDKDSTKKTTQNKNSNTTTTKTQ